MVTRGLYSYLKNHQKSPNGSSWGCSKKCFFFERSGQIQLFQNEKVIISHHKSTEVVKIVWFSHTSLLLLKKNSRKTDIFPVLGKLTHMGLSYIWHGLPDIWPTLPNIGQHCLIFIQDCVALVYNRHMAPPSRITIKIVENCQFLPSKMAILD